MCFLNFIQKEILPLTSSSNVTNLFVISTLLFLSGILGVVCNRSNFLVSLLFIELMYLGIISSCVLVSVVTSSAGVQVYSLLILILAASESAIGLGVLIVLFRFGKTLNFEVYEILHG